MNYSETKIKEAIREGLADFLGALYTKKAKETGNPYVFAEGMTEENHKLLNKITEETYDKLYEKGFLHV